MNANDLTVRQLPSQVQDALWIRDQWISELHDRIRMLNAVLQEWDIVHPTMLSADEVLPGEQR